VEKALGFDIGWQYLKKGSLTKLLGVNFSIDNLKPLPILKSVRRSLRQIKLKQTTTTVNGTVSGNTKFKVNQYVNQSRVGDTEAAAISGVKSLTYVGNRQEV